MQDSKSDLLQGEGLLAFQTSHLPDSSKALRMGAGGGKAPTDGFTLEAERT